MDKTLSRFFLMLIFVLAGAIACMMLSATTVFAAENQKKYEYTIHSEDGRFVISGAYDNGGSYGLGASETLDGVMQVINYDRQSNGGYEDIKINFQNLNVGNDCLKLARGNITLTGSLCGANFSTFGLVYVDEGANVTFEDLTLQNQGPSYLVRNDGSGLLNFVSGTYSSLSTGIISRGPADIVIKGGNFIAENSSAVEFVPSSPVAKLQIYAESLTRITSKSQTSPTVNAKNALVEISGGTIKNLSSGKALSLENVLFSISNNPKISGGEIDIETNQKIIAEGYIGDEISVLYNDVIIENQTIVVEGITQPVFILKNEGFTLTEKAGNLVASKTYALTYVDLSNYLYFVPTENEKFLAGDVAEVKMPSSASFKANILNLVNFLGWSKDQAAQIPTYTEENPQLTFENQDITLYAVWENREYHINYAGIEDAFNHNPLEYTANQETAFENPEKKYYKFTGWVVNGKGAPQTNLVLPATTYGDITLTATWALEEYNILYNGLPDEVVSLLNLPTSYTIETQPLEINLSKVLVKGYTFFGVYLDSNKTITCDEIIYFQPSKHDDNSASFNSTNTIGEDINFYIDARPYFNGTGEGTQENPFMISTFQEFQALLIGQKIKNTGLIYVALANDITFSQKLAENAKLTGFVLDGNGHSIVAQTFSRAFDALCVLPSIEKAEVKNLVVVSDSQTINASAKTNFAGFAGKIVNSKLQNVEINMPVTFACEGISTISTIKFGALTLTAQNSTFDGVNNASDFEVNVLSAGGDVNIYGAGLVGFSADGCLFVNCKQTANITVEICALPYETHTYLAGLACVGADNQIVNCLNSGRLSLIQETPNQAVLCGLVMPFGGANVAKNVALSKSILAEESDKVIVEEISLTSCAQTDAFKPNDFEHNLSQTLKKLVKNIDAIQEEFGIELCTWFAGENGVDFTKGLYVQFVGGQMMPTKTLYFSTPQDAKNAYLWFDTNKYMFYGWKTESGEYVDWDNVVGPNLTLTADYALFEDLILEAQIKFVAFEGVILLLVLFVMWLFDRKKMVYFVKEGRPVGAVKVARTKKVPLPNAFDGKICFLDEKGHKPFLENKMPCHSITLYVFDEFKQSRLEHALKAKAQNQKQLALNNILLKGIIRERRKEMKKSRKLSSRSTQKTFAPKPDDKQNAVVIGGEGNKITIIKKEIKIIKNEENLLEKNKNTSKKIKKSKK